MAEHSHGAKQHPRDRGGQLTIKERKLRGFRAYLDLLDAADWMRRELRDQLESFDVTVDGFRLLELLYREGAVTTTAFRERRRCSRQAVGTILRPLEERGWVRYDVVMLAPVEVEESRLAKRLWGKPRRGRMMGRISLTPAGQKFIGIIFPRHTKRVFALMRAIDGREQESLSQTCRKLREGNIVKFLDEISMEDVE